MNTENFDPADPRPEVLRNLPASFTRNHRSVLKRKKEVLFFDPYTSRQIQKYIITKIDEVRSTFKSAGLSFLYPQEPELAKNPATDEMLRYFFPATAARMQSSGFRNPELLQAAGTLLTEYLNLSEITSPCLIRVVSTDQKKEETVYSVFYLPEDEDMLEEALDYYIERTREDSVVFKSPGLHLHDPEDIQDHKIAKSASGVRFSQRPASSPWADTAGVELEESVEKEIKKIIKAHKQQGAAAVIMQVLRELKKSGGIKDPQLKALAASFPAEEAQPLSRLVIQKDGGVFLPDYNLSIPMTPLQKTVYIFFLKNTSGIRFKQLPDYKRELESIYLSVATRTDPEDLKDSIDKLADPYSNSMSEKCSKIKEVFLKTFSENIAEYYYIKGSRHESKKISLDRQLVTFEY